VKKRIRCASCKQEFFEAHDSTGKKGYCFKCRGTSGEFIFRCIKHKIQCQLIDSAPKPRKQQGFCYQCDAVVIVTERIRCSICKDQFLSQTKDSRESTCYKCSTRVPVDIFHKCMRCKSHNCTPISS